ADPAPADFNGDGVADGADFLLWQQGLGLPAALKGDGDANNDQVVDAADLAIWEAQFGLAAPAVAVGSAAAIASANTISPTRAILSPRIVDFVTPELWIGQSIKDGVGRDRQFTSALFNLDAPFRICPPSSSAIIANRDLDAPPEWHSV